MICDHSIGVEGNDPSLLQSFWPRSFAQAAAFSWNVLPPDLHRASPSFHLHFNVYVTHSERHSMVTHSNTLLHFNSPCGTYYNELVCMCMCVLTYLFLAYFFLLEYKIQESKHLICLVLDMKV